jgi:putative acetyltransferase
VQIVEASLSDLEDVLSVERAAFGEDDEAMLVCNLLDDPSAQPLLSLLAREGEQAVGHILFTAARLDGAPQMVSIAVLAPLAVVPEAQTRGVGRQLIERGVQLLSESGVELVFVLGHPTYYPRHGFAPASSLRFVPPFPIPPKDEMAWMVRALGTEVIDSIHGRVVCADSLNKLEYWRE